MADLAWLSDADEGDSWSPPPWSGEGLGFAEKIGVPPSPHCECTRFRFGGRTRCALPRESDDPQHQPAGVAVRRGAAPKPRSSRTAVARQTAVTRAAADLCCNQ